ncbi:DUF6712 family protein [Mucilaginibacter ginkgonis]|uniref:Uncharacterized protein n=1 Tax=Mucilaginibacter ginkgonis TaxID=2682091 RepID=A0A6I4HTZ1_9SPHI|nr:hypothetical protein [Mucilaginibacter ginkgonis]QQL50330.1 hypothetical protein GO620_002425 [Mucilaginibacter ginkgonis]
MTQVYFINQASFAPYQDISINVKPARLNTFIKKAQDLDLRLILGDRLFYDLLKCCNQNGTTKDDAPAQYVKLIMGCDYTNGLGQELSYDGLTPALVYFTLSRLVENDSIKYTANGPVVKAAEGNTHLSYSDTVKIAQQYRSIANSYTRGIESFLNANSTDFPQWQYNESLVTARQPGARIRSVDKTEFNYPAADQFFNTEIFYK